MEELLKKLLETEDKIISCQEKFVIKKIELMNDLDLIKLNLQQKNLIYEDLVLIKGTIFPIPQKDNILSVTKMYLEFNNYYQLNLFVEGKIDKESESPVLEGNTKNVSFEYKVIYKTISELTNISLYEINSTIFRIINILDNGVVNIKSISDYKDYTIDLNKEQIDKYKKDDFLWITYYQLNRNKIVKNKMTIIKILDEEKLIDFFDCIPMKNINLFQVIDINDNDIILIDKKQNINKLDKNNNFIKNNNIDFYSTVIISNYVNDFENKIKLTENSFFYTFKIESYYIENIITNLISILELHFLDYNEKNNKFDCISSILFDDKKISNKIEYIICSSIYLKKYEFYPFQLKLYNSKNKDIIAITFTVYLYPGVINKINVFLNTKSAKTYFFEYLYYNLTDNLGEIEENINVDGNNYKININDNFGSKNRKRISIMNIPYQEMIIPENQLKTNSIQICELTQYKMKRIIGIYDILNVFDEIENYNDYFDEYYENFGDIYEMIKYFTPLNFDNITQALKDKQKKFNKIHLEYNILDTNNFNKSLTLSQFKAWFGLIICLFIKMKNNLTTDIKKIIKETLSIYLEIQNKNLKYIDIIRIIIYSLDEKILKNSNFNLELKFISELDKNSPYFLAFEFNKKQIESLNEFHPLFQAYLQLDSYKAYNYLHSTETHTFSLELVFMLKYQLLSTFEDFFFVKREDNDEYSLLHNNTRITVINELTTLGINYKESEVIKDPNKAKNYAMPLYIDFLHEKGGHYKFSLKNKDDISPCIYFKELRAEIEVSYISNKGLLLYGESGRIIENFICKDKKIIDALSSKFIFGELLDNKYFGGKDFTELVNAVKNKLQIEEEKEKEKENEKKYDKKKNKNVDKDVNNIKNKNDILLDFPSSGKIGDMIFDVNKIKRNIMMSKEEKEIKYKENLMNRKKKIMDLKKRKNSIK